MKVNDEIYGEGIIINTGDIIIEEEIILGTITNVGVIIIEEEIFLVKEVMTGIKGDGVFTINPVII